MAMSLETISTLTWTGGCPSETRAQAIESLEHGAVLCFPKLAFRLVQNELLFLSPALVAPRSKNISLDSNTGVVSGATCTGDSHEQLKEMMLRFFSHARTFLHALLPRYAESLLPGRTSFRPVEISGRRSSSKQDDTLLHVDAFPAHPVQGSRILRLFSNVSDRGKDRIWRIGGQFEDVAKVFLPRLPQSIPGGSGILKTLGITKSYRTRYDHLMLHLHDAMKADDIYQKSVEHTEVRFPPGSTWTLFTDQVPHAAVAGQHVLEQTFYLPVAAMADENLSPLRILERLSQTPLV